MTGQFICRYLNKNSTFFSLNMRSVFSYHNYFLKDLPSEKSSLILSKLTVCFEERVSSFVNQGNSAKGINTDRTSQEQYVVSCGASKSIVINFSV